MRPCRRITDFAKRLAFIAASTTVLPVLVGCSSPSSNDYSLAASAYPSQSLSELLFKDSVNSTQSVRTTGAPAQPNSSAAVVSTAPASAPDSTPTSSSASAAAVASAPAPSASSDNYNAAASAYPSVPLIDLLWGSGKTPDR